MLFLDILCYFWGTVLDFFQFQDSGYETSYKNKHCWSFLIMQMGRRIKYSIWNWSNSLLGVSHWWIKQLRRNFPWCSSPRHFFAPKFGWTSSSFREDVLRMTLLIAMRLNFWDVPKFLISKSIVSIRKMNQFVMFFWYFCLKKNEYWTTDNTIINERILKANFGIKLHVAWLASGRCQTLSRPSRLVHKK